MSKKPNHEADIVNANKGTSGVNDTFKQNQDNKSEQLNPNNEKFQPKKATDGNNGK